MPKAEITAIQTMVNRRFFTAIEALVERGDIKSLSGFITQCELHAPRYREMRAVYGIRPTMGSSSRYVAVETEALFYLIARYHVSADWLMTGRGRMIEHNETYR